MYETSTLNSSFGSLAVLLSIRLKSSSVTRGMTPLSEPSDPDSSGIGSARNQVNRKVRADPHPIILSAQEQSLMCKRSSTWMLSQCATHRTSRSLSVHMQRYSNCIPQNCGPRVPSRHPERVFAVRRILVHLELPLTSMTCLVVVTSRHEPASNIP
jgi:hypothetical protein